MGRGGGLRVETRHGQQYGADEALVCNRGGLPARGQAQDAPPKVNRAGRGQRRAALARLAAQPQELQQRLCASAAKVLQRALEAVSRVLRLALAAYVPHSDKDCVTVRGRHCKSSLTRTHEHHDTGHPQLHASLPRGEVAVFEDG